MASQWYYTKNGQQVGPVDSAELKALAGSGQLKPAEHVWKEGMADWVEAKTIKGLFSPSGVKASFIPSGPAQVGRSVPVYDRESAARDDEQDDAADDGAEYRAPRRKRRQETNTATLVGLGVGAVVLVGAIVAGVILFTRAGKNDPVPEANAEPVVDAVTLVRDYQTDRNAADRKYKGKTLLVQGPVFFRNGNALHLETDLPSILPGVPPGTTDQVVAIFKNARDSESIALGSVIQIQGECRGFNRELDVEMHNCKFIKKVGQLPFKEPAKKPPFGLPPIKQPPIKQPPFVQPPLGQPPLDQGNSVEVFRAQDKLSLKDPLDTVRKASNAKVHTFRMQAGKTYIIDLKSPQFDSYLRLEDSQRKQLAADDDGGGALDARITFLALRDDDYRLIVTTFDGRRAGDYTLTVREKK